MAETALSGFANASAVFTIPASGTVTDAATGNVKPNTTTTTVALFAKASPPVDRDLPGVEVGGTTYVCRCVNPGQLPAAVVAGTKGTVSFDGGAFVPCVVMSAREPYGSAAGIGAIVRSAVGDSITLMAYPRR